MVASLLCCDDRRQLRRAVRTDCYVVSDQGFRFLGQTTRDLSMRGMLLESCVDIISIDQPVLIALRAPGTERWLDLQGRVARVIRGLRERDQGPALGIDFQRIQRGGSRILRHSLRGTPPPPPQRRLRRDYAQAVRRISARHPDQVEPTQVRQAIAPSTSGWDCSAHTMLRLFRASAPFTPRR